MKDVKKLTVLEFKKEQLVNLNQEEASAIKGGASSFVCAVDSVRKGCFHKYEKWFGGRDEKPSDFQITDNYLGSDITCASFPELVVYG